MRRPCRHLHTVGLNVVIAVYFLFLAGCRAPEEPRRGEGLRETATSIQSTSGGKHHAQTINLGDGVTLALVWIPPGTFTMGSPADEAEREEHERQFTVTLTQGFWLGETEVTQAQWEAVMENNPSHYTGQADLPVENITWGEAFEFCRKAAEQTGLELTLPTEAQWEYACRAGTTTRFCFGDGAGELGDYAWYVENSNNRTHPVRGKQSNAWGLYDMHGNIWEWCLDWHADYPSGHQTDWVQLQPAFSRVDRGGGWGDTPKFCRSALRDALRLDDRHADVGFRLAAVPGARD